MKTKEVVKLKDFNAILTKGNKLQINDYTKGGWASRADKLWKDNQEIYGRKLTLDKDCLLRFVQTHLGATSVSGG